MASSPIIEDDALPAVYAVIVHWLHMKDTVECLKSLAHVDYPRFRVVLVNNASPDFDAKQAREAFPDVVITQAGTNLGFAGGNNLGIGRALDDGANVVLLLNSDTVVTPDIVRVMLPALSVPDAGLAAPVITYYDEPNKVWFAGGHYSEWLGYSYRRHPLAPFEGHEVVDWVNGCAILIKREVFERVGLLWEPFFLNCEEVDLCLRARLAHYKSIQVGQALVRHKVSASGGVRGSDLFSPDKAYYFGRNYLLLLRRNASGFHVLSGLIGQILLVFPYWSLLSIFAGNAGVIPHYLMGMRDGILGRAGRRPLVRGQGMD